MEKKPAINKDKDILEQIHINIHALRLIPNYKPSSFEVKVAKIIAERFADSCEECKLKNEQYKTQPEAKSKPGIMSRLKNAMEETE